VRRRGAPGSPQATYDAEVAPGWDILGNANGGYLLAIAARATADHLGRADPVTVTAHFVAPGRPGPLAVDVSSVRAGRRFATARAEVRSVPPEGDPLTLMAVLATCGELAEPGSVVLVDAEPPVLPPPEECVSHRRTDDVHVADPDRPSAPTFMDRVELRLHPVDAGFGVGDPSGEPRVRGWFRLPGEEPIDTIGLLQVLDAFPPTVFNARLPFNWVPTLELTCHVRSRPAPGWLACEFTTRFVTGGFLEEDGVVWDSAGTLVAQSRQLALMPRG
jgi:acyl-CoA thioesterase